MEETKPPFVKATLGYGLILAAAVIVYDLILYLLDLKTNAWLPFLSYVIMVVGAFMAQTSFRNKHMDGYCTYGQIFKVGLLTFVFVSIVMAIYTYLYYAAINPGALQEEMDLTEQKMLERGSSDMDVEQTVEFLSMMQKPWLKAIFALGTIIVGLIITLITSIFVKKEPVSTPE